MWGDPLGAKLQAGGLSIPRYDEGGGQQPTEQDIERELWTHLYCDPLYELRVIAISSTKPVGLAPGQKPPGNQLDDSLKKFSVSNELQEGLQQGQIDTVFNSTLESIRDRSNNTYWDMLKVVTYPFGNFRIALARAIVAHAISLYRDKYSDKEPTIYRNAKLRDEVVELMA